MYILILDFCLFMAVGFLPQKLGVIIWRIASVFAIIWGIVSIYRWEYTFGLFTILSTCFIAIPLYPKTATCRKCNKKIYWYGLISNKCPNCGEKFY